MLEYTAARGPLAHDLVSSCKVQLQRSEHCFAAYNVRSVDKLSGRTTGRLGGNRQDTAHTIGGTTVVMTPGRPGAAGAWATQLHLQVTVNGDCEPAGAEYTAAEPPAPQDLPGTTGWAGRKQPKPMPQYGQKQPKPTPTLSRLEVTVNGDCEPAGAEYTAAEPPAPQDLPGTTGWAGQKQPMPTPTISRLQYGQKQPKPTPTQSRLQYLARDYGPNGDANGLCWSTPQHADHSPTIWCPPARCDCSGPSTVSPHTT
jgi:hypothetical protein